MKHDHHSMECRKVFDCASNRALMKSFIAVHTSTMHYMHTTHPSVSDRFVRCAPHVRARTDERASVHRTRGNKA